MGIQRIDSRAGKGLAHLGMQRLGNVRQLRRPRALERLAHQPAVVAALVEQSAPGFGDADGGHCAEANALGSLES